ncbi:MAG: signal peptidase I [Bacillota bacterium]|nr:signal peptidase I [Bacillota bacterium]
MRKVEYTTDEQIEQMREELRQAKLKKGMHIDMHHVLVIVRKTVSMVLFLAVVAALTTTLVFIQLAKSKGQTPDILGYQLYVIQSGSMSPTLKVGAVIISHIPDDKSDLKVDDIVTFKTESGATVTHRIIETVKSADGKIRYRTKGDNPVNSADQELLDPDRVIAEFIAKVPLT